MSPGAAFRLMREPALATGRDGRIAAVNPAFEDACGWRAAELIGCRPTILRPELDGGPACRAVRAEVAAGRIWSGHLAIRGRGGRRLAGPCTVAPLERDEGGCIAILHRGTAGEEDPRRARFERLGRAAGGAVHDLNNLLAPILAAGELLLRRVPVAQRPFAEAVVTSGERARRLVRRLLSPDAGERVPVGLDRLITGFAGVLRGQFADPARLRLILAGDLPAVTGDPARIEQVLLNLVVNARDAGEGAVVVRTRAEADGAIVEVVDEGIGMSDAVRARLAEPFFTTKPAGTGLGLHAVHAIVAEHGGSIAFDSRPGCGTTVRVRFPVSAREPVWA